MATISFGQGLDPKTIERAAEAAKGTDLVLALGSTLSVYPAAGFPLMAARRGIPYIIINQGITEHDDEPSVTLRLDGKVEDILPSVVDSLLS